MKQKELKGKIKRAEAACTKYLPDEEHDNLLDVMMEGAINAKQYGIVVGGVIGSVITGVVILLLT